MLMIICPFKKINLFLEARNSKNLIFLDKLCHLKNNKDKYNSIFIDCSMLTEEGIIKDFNYSLDEVFITNNINNVVCINKNNKIKEICKYYKVNLIEIKT